MGRNETLEITAHHVARGPSLPHRWILAALVFCAGADPAFGSLLIGTVAGGRSGYKGDSGPAIQAGLTGPLGVAVDAQGNFFIADTGANVVRKVTAATGKIATWAGSGTVGYSGDGGSAVNARLSGPTSVAVDASGNVYVADTNNNVIRRVSAGGVITTFAGTGAKACAGAGGLAANAQLSGPRGVTVDAGGNVYIADAGCEVVRKVDTSGVITTVAGNGNWGYTDNLLATSAELANPSGVAVDASGNLYIADQANYVVRAVDHGSGLIRTFAGTGIQGYSGDGAAATQAELESPTGVAADAAGNVYIADRQICAIREVDHASGSIAAVAGNGTCGYLGDAGLATSAELYFPAGVAVSMAGALYIADSSNNAIREVSAACQVSGAVRTSDAQGLAGVDIAVTGSASTATKTATDGTYAISLAAGGTYVLTPSSGSYGFTPASISTVNLSAAAGGNDFTALKPPGLATPGFLPTALSSDSLSAQWTSGGNAGTLLYEADISTDPGFGRIASSTTYNTQASFGEAGGATPLSPNTTYYARVRIVDDGSGNHSVWAPLGSTSTFAAPPAGLVFQNLSTSAFTAGWSSSNGPQTRYQAVLAADPGFSPVLATATTTGLSAAFSRLNAGTQYFVAVAALGNNGDTAFSAAAATVTWLAPPGLGAAGFLPTALSSDSLSAQWTSGGNAGTLLYEADISTDPGFGRIASSTTYNTQASFGEAGGATPLSPNTTYYARVRIVDDGSGNHSVWAPLGSTSTFAAPPAGLSFSGVYLSSFTVQWSDGVNAPGVSYVAELASDAGFSAGVRTVATSDFNAAFTGLSPQTRYYVAVQAAGNNGPSVWTAAQSAFTLPAAPGNLTATALGVSSISWTWNAAVGATGYDFYPATGGPAGFTQAATLMQTGLATNTFYGAQISALDASGEGVRSQAGIYTLAAPPTAPVVTVVSTAAVGLGWNANGNPPQTLFLAQASSDAAFAFISTQAWTADSSATLTGLDFGTTYYLRVRASNGDGRASVFCAAISTGTPRPTAYGLFAPGQPLQMSLSQPAGPVMLYVPPSAFPQGVQVTIQTPRSLDCGSSVVPGLAAMGIGVEVELSPPLEPAAEVSLSVGYGSAALAVGGDSRLVLARCDTALNAWVPLVSHVDSRNHAVQASSRHLSLFQVLQASPPDTASDVRVSNNPLRPALGQTTMDFAALPAGAQVRVYTLLGELVKDLSADASGMASWDGTNRAGRTAASGVYLVLIQGHGQEKTIKVAVER